MEKKQKTESYATADTNRKPCLKPKSNAQAISVVAPSFKRTYRHRYTGWSRQLQLSRWECVEKETEKEKSKLTEKPRFYLHNLYTKWKIRLVCLQSTDEYLSLSWFILRFTFFFLLCNAVRLPLSESSQEYRSLFRLEKYVCDLGRM